MKNPWIKKNPFMSMWLSTANSMMSSAKGHATAAVARGTRKAVANATTSGMNQIVDFWANTLMPPELKNSAATREPRKRRQPR
ncbi:MAG: hypothetical protein ABI633_02600 [Burkholderiales bacterium]